MSSHIPLPREKHSKSKLFVTRSLLSSKKHEHQKIIETHPFNHRLSILTRSSNALNVRASLAKHIGCHYHISLKLTDLIDPGFISNYVKRNTLIALSAGRFIDTDDVFAIDGRGMLILSVCKDTYETLGLAGRHSQFPLQRGARFVVEINLLADCMEPTKKYFQRIRSRFDAVLDEPVEFLVGYYDADTGAPVTFDLPGAAAVEPRSETCKMQGVSVPRLPEHLTAACEQSDAWVEQAQETFEWIGLAAGGVHAVAGGTVDPETSIYGAPEPSTLADVEVHTVCGMLSAKAISSVVKELLADPESCKDEFYVCVWGYDDAPVSWNLSEHSFYTSGENMYAQAYVSERGCCLTFQACGPWDAFS
ncbi:hypothetical protein GGF43_006492 [Coemansia sp. RSA 2618]|nr:hypothetical protein GGF43_006492 [Coemansia sp. RSA 2618]